MAIRRSLGGETADLLEALASAEAAVRETAAARLGALGPRAVPHLLDAFQASPSAVARAAMLKVLETLGDRRGLALAVDVLASATRDPAVAAAAIALLGTFLDDDRTEALEALGTLVVDADRPDLERLAAWQALARMPERILAPLRRRLHKDRSAALERAAAAPRAASGTPADAGLDPAAILDLATGPEAVDPAVVRLALDAAGDRIPLTQLNRLVERARVREAALSAGADRAEWLAVRAAAHAALARQGSRVAAYDIVETLAAAADALPEGFTSALGVVGDAACLEAVAEALARIPARLGAREHEWRDRLIEAGRAIVVRERLTRRHAAVKRVVRHHPDIAAVLLASSR